MSKKRRLTSTFFPGASTEAQAMQNICWMLENSNGLLERIAVALEKLAELPSPEPTDPEPERSEYEDQDLIG